MQSENQIEIAKVKAAITFKKPDLRIVIYFLHTHRLLFSFRERIKTRVI